MTRRFVGERVLRNEDVELLTGRALFTDDVELPGMLHVAFVRSDFAHARLKGIDTSPARTMPGVVAVFTAADLGDYWKPGPLLVSPPPIQRLVFRARTQVPLAKEKVRHVGEPIAVVVAESRYLAEDAACALFADLEPLAAVADAERALASDSPRIHEDLDSNLNAHVVQTKGDYAAAKARADLVIARRFSYDRGTAAAMENRGIVAWWDEKTRSLMVWDATQAPIPIRNGLAAMLGLSQSQVQVVAPFVGGGFGPKIMMFYPEEVVLPWIAMRLGRPVKWIEDRRENFLATTQERGQIHDAELALTREGKILGVRDSFLHDTGAYSPYGLTVPINSQCTLVGPYDVPNYESEFRTVFTNKIYVTPYRGAGRQHGVFVMERLLDFAARELRLDPIEIRRRNYLPPGAFPHGHEIIYQDFTKLVYDSGNYLPAMEKMEKLLGYREFKEVEQPRLRAEGRQVGIGVVSYVEGTGIGPYEGARVRVEPSGKVEVATGFGTQGQGHYTSFAQIVAEELGVEVPDVRVVTGDTREFHWGTGTFASRGIVVVGNACHAAARRVREKILAHGARFLGVKPEELVLSAGAVAVAGDPSRRVALGELALMANPLRGAVAPGTEPGLEATSYYGPDRGTTASGVHGIVLELDPVTFRVEVAKYAVVHDCGRIVNPMIVEGQIVGGVAQGLGNCYYEELRFDENAQLQNASFMDYLLPTAGDVPREILLDHVETPSPLGALGVKGVGEAGCIPTAAAFAQAIEDALAGTGVEVLSIPLSPDRLFHLVEDARSRRNAK
ncbi:MAG: xanthine dehydrogenase family protein molybdopterin-binding subunit [Planctomycetes bacterium]|nr:xanthine dehydrogenase family protein molybdopterin-binding subunit [Planctomycetota bacterium]